MEKNPVLLNKALVIGIIFLFIGLSITTSVAVNTIKQSFMPTSNGNILYVGGTGPGNYTKIKDAINDADDGYTVFVYDDSSPYYENINIYKSINLIGENKNTTIIDGQNITWVDTVRIIAPYVNISGFTIQHCGTTVNDAGIEIDNVDYCTIKDNIITLNEDHGILLDYSNGNTVSGNIITNNHGDWYHGICLMSSHNNVFVDNNISNNGYGFDMHYSDNNVIKNNIISNNYDEEGNHGTGIWSHNCNNVIIINNNISYNHGRGIDLYDSDNNKIVENTIVGNGWGANNADGICLRVGSNRNLIKRNIINGNKYDGIDGSDGANNLIIENIIKDNVRRGMENGEASSVIYHNNFINNPKNGYKGSNIWNSDYPIGGNYWDDYNGVDNFRGPDQDIPGSDGLGDTPYNISESICQDVYPLINKWGENAPYVDFIYMGENLTLTFDASISVDRDGTIVSYEWDFGDGNNGTGKFINHTYTTDSNYTVTLMVTDNDGKKHNKTRTVVKFNIPPSTPTAPIGLDMLKPYISGKYYTETSDPNDDMVQYRFDWDAEGSHDYSCFSGLVPSGTQVNMTHWWESVGTYVVKAQACDEYGFASDWSAGLTVLVNNPPNEPFNPEPQNGAIDVDIDADLSWSCNDPDGDNLTYNVYFGNSSPPPLVSLNQEETTYDPGTMEYDTTYFWQIIAKDENSATTESPIWSFITCLFPNDPPYVPSDPSPENNAVNVTIDVDLSWVGGDPDENDTVVYDVYFEAEDQTPDIKVVDDFNETCFNLGILEYGTTYYWQIVAKDNHYAITEGPVWHFTTEENNPPNMPSIDGPNRGKPGVEYDYNFSLIDSNDDAMRLRVDWGSGTPGKWYGPYDSGTKVKLNHTWNQRGTFTIRAQAEDIFGAESSWSEFEVTIPRNKATIGSLLQLFLDRFPLLEVFLRAMNLLR